MTLDATKSMQISVKSNSKQTSLTSTRGSLLRVKSGYRGYNTIYGNIKIRFAEFGVLFFTPVAALTAILFYMHAICFPEKFQGKRNYSIEDRYV